MGSRSTVTRMELPMPVSVSAPSTRCSCTRAYVGESADERPSSVSRTWREHEDGRRRPLRDIYEIEARAHFFPLP